MCQRHMLSAAIPIATLEAKWPFGTGPAIPRSATPRASSMAPAASAPPAHADGPAATSRVRQARSRQALENLGALIIKAELHLHEPGASQRVSQPSLLFGVEEQE